MQNLFGTDGIRGKYGTGFFVEQNLTHFAHAFCEWLIHNKQLKTPHILLLHDTRVSCDAIKMILTAGMQGYPVTIFDAGVLPTPAALHLMKTNLFDCAIIISASHNPWYDNGIKIIDRSGKLSSADELIMSGYYAEQKACCLSSSMLEQTVIYDGVYEYLSQIKRLMPKLDLTGKRIVLDCANGAMYEVAPMIMRAYGADVIVLNDKPDGQNINDSCGALHPALLQQAVVEHQAFIGFAFDGDGDRVIAVNRAGQVKDGDDILALLMQLPAYADQPAVVGTVMSNEGFAQYLAQHHKTLIRVDVGDKYVLERLIADNLMLGGEPAGHIIMRDTLTTGDGLLVALRVLESLMITNNVDCITFTKFPQVKINVTYSISRAQCEQAVQKIAQEAQQAMHAGRVLIRFSGTEPLIRIMVEAETQAECEMLAMDLQAKVQKILG